MALSSFFNRKEKDEQKKLISKPLFLQSIKSNFWLWFALSVGSAFIFIILFLVVGTKQLFANMDMAKISQYIKDENMNWLQVLGLLEAMGFNLSRIQVLSSVDLNSILNDLVFKITGVFLPMIFVMITCNRLLASQVSDGSMAYVLSTPTNRKKVVRTQYLYILTALVGMYIIITAAAFTSGAIAFAINPDKRINFGTFALRTILFCFASFLSMFALTGICFGASGWFSKSSQSIAVGGGICVTCFLACILGLFGNKVFVATGVGVKEMSVFNYFSVFSLLDMEEMSNFAKAATRVENAPIMTFNWIWKLGILVVIGIVFAFIGAKKFQKKDLPL